MSIDKDFLKYELYPALYDCIDIALPEHNFKRSPDAWRSKTYIDGSPHKDRADKTVITKKEPGRILEQGGESISLIDYVIRRDGGGFIDAVKTLAAIAGVTLPKAEFNSAQYEAFKMRQDILSTANRFFIDSLEKATDGLAYLSGRGYSSEDVKAMEIGYIPSQAELNTYLQERGFTADQINTNLRLNSGIGETHRLTIPYRSGGSIRGFKFRTLTDAKPKYLNTTTEGLRVEGFFNLLAVKGDKDVVVVEGELDSLIATAKGIENVVATTGSSINEEQIRDAIRLGAKSFTLCFDTEPQKAQETEDKLIKAAELILAEGVNRVYIVTLPDLDGVKTDVDSLIREKGVEAFKEALSKRQRYGAYLGAKLLRDYIAKADKDGEIDPKERDLLREKIVEIRSALSPQDRQEFNREAVEPLRGHGFTEEQLLEVEESFKEAQAKAKKAQEVNKLKAEVSREKDPDKAVIALEKGLRRISIGAGKDLLPPERSYADIKRLIGNMPPAKKSGIRALDKFIGYRTGAMTIIAGRPGHGKSTFFFNLLLNMSRLYPKERFYFFSYEEATQDVTIKLLSILAATDFREYSLEYNSEGLNNYEFIKEYTNRGRTDIEEITNAEIELSELIDSKRINIIDRRYSVEDLGRVVAYLNATNKIGAVFIDYAQRIGAERSLQDVRVTNSHVSNTLKDIATTTGLPLIVGSQLNRSAVKEGSKKPTLENLKESGNYEEDANTVIAIYNESRENEEDGNGEAYGRYVDIEIKTLKNREGEANRKALIEFDRYTLRMYDKIRSKV